jgi:hypothetical protein
MRMATEIKTDIETLFEQNQCQVSYKWLILLEKIIE